MSRATRTYTVTAYQPGGFVNYPGEEWKSNRRIRQFALIVFEKYFGGLKPTFHWHKDGFMAQARDERGNEVTVEQTNWWHRFSGGGTSMKRPCCPMVVKEGKR